MKINRCIIVWIFLALVQPLLSNPRFFLLTVGPGDEAYELYGHTGFRVVDSIEQIDYVVDWGVFDFNQPDFYLNFALGKMRYTTGCWDTDDFIKSTKSEGKTLIMQEILLNDSQKKQLFSLITNNLRPENRDYDYDFIFDNCATRPFHLIKKTMGTTLKYPIQPDTLTFREIITSYQKEKPFYNLLINIVLGSSLDRIATFEEQMFIPEYLQRNLSLTYVSDSIEHPLLSSPKILAQVKPSKSYDLQLLPLFIFAALTIIIFFLDISHKQQKLIRIFTYIYFISLLLIGFIIIFLWFFTNHQSTYLNYNLLWANPLLIFPFIAFIQRKHKRWIQLTRIYYILFLIIWATGIIPQALPSAIVGIVLLLLERCYFITTNNTSK